MEKNRPPGDIFIDLANDYPDEELLHISAVEPHLVMTKPRLLADLLVHRAYDFIKPPKISGFLRHVLGDGLIIVEGDQHKFLRKNSMPAFGFRHIKDLYPMIWSKAVAFVTALKQETKGNPVQESVTEPGTIELTSWASRVTLDIIGIAGLGRRFDMLHKSDDPIMDIYEQLLDPAMEKLAFALSCITFDRELIRWIPWKMNNLFNYLTSSLSDICADLIKDKREAIVKKADDHFDILSLLIKSDNFSDTELKDQLLTFLAAG
jgi:cytochrome P450